ncbi:MAG: hypothetical protein U0800_24835 [Isosphaeraceae bacterium]
MMPTFVENRDGVDRYEIATPVALGTFVQFTLDPGTPTLYKSIQWSGGSDWDHYFSTDANKKAVSPMRPYQVTKTNAVTYGFVVDYSKDHYEVKVDVVNKDDPTGTTYTSTIDFDVEKPTATLTVTSGSTKVYSGADFAALQYDNGTTGKWPDDAGMQITATTTTPGHTSGDFMFLQLTNFARFAWDANGNRFKMTPIGGGRAIDNSFEYRTLRPYGPTLVSGAYGYPVADPPPNANAVNLHSWRIATTDTADHRTMGDSPFVVVSNPSPWNFNFAKLQVGVEGTGARNETFDAYVMWRPSSYGTWIGIAKVHWEWGGRIQIDENGAWPEQPTPFNPAPAPLVTNSFDQMTDVDDYFPSWTDSTINIFARGMVAY